MRKYRSSLEVDLIGSKSACGQMGKEMLDDFRLDLRLCRRLLAPVVDLQFAAGRAGEQFAGDLLDGLRSPLVSALPCRSNTAS